LLIILLQNLNSNVYLTGACLGEFPAINM